MKRIKIGETCQQCGQINLAKHWPVSGGLSFGYEHLGLVTVWIGHVHLHLLPRGFWRSWRGWGKDATLPIFNVGPFAVVCWMPKEFRRSLYSAD